jgi:hypothetical protein
VQADPTVQPGNISRERIHRIGSKRCALQ